MNKHGQWTYNALMDALQDYAKEQGFDVIDGNMAIAFLLRQKEIIERFQQMELNASAAEHFYQVQSEISGDRWSDENGNDRDEGDMPAPLPVTSSLKTILNRQINASAVSYNHAEATSEKLLQALLTKAAEKNDDAQGLLLVLFPQPKEEKEKKTKKPKMTGGEKHVELEEGRRNSRSDFRIEWD